jgi:hypothetical protein
VITDKISNDKRILNAIAYNKSDLYLFLNFVTWNTESDLPKKFLKIVTRMHWLIFDQILDDVRILNAIVYNNTDLVFFRQISFCRITS